MIYSPIDNWPIHKPQTLKVDFSISYMYFQYPKGKMGITSLRIVRLQNFNHRCKWENVHFSNTLRTQWPCGQKSLILTAWSTFCLWNQGPKQKWSDFPQCLKITEVKLLTSFITVTYWSWVTYFRLLNFEFDVFE